MVDPSWDLYRSFRAVLREGSLSGAARALGLTQPTVGRHIAELEQSLGGALFTRSQTGLVPTQSALNLVQHADAMAASAEALVRAASGEPDEPKGSVRVTASEFVGALVLPAMLTSFREAHPKIAVEMALSNRNQDLLRHEADIAVRMAEPTQQALVAKKIGDVKICLFAHRQYLKRHGIPRDLNELVTKHAVIGFDRDASALRALRATGLGITRDLFALRTDSDPAQFQAIRSGFGIGACQVGAAIKARELVPVLADGFGFQLGMWLVMHEDLKTSRRVRLLFDHLAANLAAYAKMDLASGNR